MILHNLFPTPVAKFEIGREFTSEEIEFVNQQSRRKNVGNTVSDNTYVLQDNTFSNILKFVQKSVDSYFNSIYAPKENIRLRTTQSWLNYSKPGEWHHRHTHANSFVSGVLYMKAAKENDRIYFYKNDHEHIQIPTNNWNLYNSRSWWLEVGTGDLMLFPSSLTHAVELVQGEERISLAFNTFPVGYVGQEETLTALHLRD